MATFHKRHRGDAFVQINVTPLIDLAWALLIIFMITTPFLEHSIPINLPKETRASGQHQKGSEKVQVINIRGDGQCFWGDEAVDLNILDRRLAELAALPEPPTIHVRADAGISYQKVIDVIDLIKHNRLHKLALDTQA